MLNRFFHENDSDDKFDIVYRLMDRVHFRRMSLCSADFPYCDMDTELMREAAEVIMKLRQQLYADSFSQHD